MVHYSRVSIADFEQVNIGWNLSGSFQKLKSWKNLKKSHAWPVKRLSPTRKFFKGDHWIVPELKQLVTQTNHNKNLIFLMADIALQYTVKTSFANLHKSFSSSSYSCLPMKVCKSEVYKYIFQPLDTHCSCFFLEKFESWYTCSHQNLYKISEGKNSIQSHSYCLVKRFHNPPATQEIKL